MRSWVSYRVLSGLLLLIVMILPTASGIAQVPAADSGAPSPAAQGSSTSPDVAGNSNAQDYKLSPDKYARAVAYHRQGYWLYFVTAAYTLFLLWAFVHWRIAPRLRSWSEKISQRTWAQLLICAPMMLLAFGILLLPTDTYDQWRMRKYGLSVQSWSSWFSDWSGAEIATLAAGTLVIGLLFYTMGRSPRRWWFFLWMIALPLFVLFAFIQPIAVDPLFNTFELLDKSHPELVDSIETLLNRARLVIPREHIYLLKVSDKTTEVDASSEGFGPTKRIFVSDTIIASEPGPAIMHTLGHEIGHYMLNLDWIVFAFGVPLSLGLLYFIDRLFVSALVRWGPAWTIRGPADWASLPVLVFIVSVITIALTPAVNSLSRYREHEADRYGLEVIHGIIPHAGEVAAQAFQRDGELNLSDPDPPRFIRWWLFDHPPVNDRIHFCRTYDPWSDGKKPRYVQ